MRSSELFSVVAILLLYDVDAYNIMFFTFYGSPSHTTTFLPALDALSRRGHNVTYLTVLPVAKSFPTVTVHVLDTVYEFLVSKKANVFDINLKMNDTKKMVKYAYTASVDSCAVFLKDPAFRTIVADKSTRYDVVLMDPMFAECGLALLHLLGNPPLIYYCTTHLYAWIAFSLGIPTPLAYVPVITMRAPNLRALEDRIRNAYEYHKYNIFRNYLLMGVIEDIVHSVYPTMPPLLAIERNVSFVFANSHSSSLDIRRPTTQYFAEVGGTHCRSPNPLPKELEEFINGAEDNGFIYMSFGTYVSDTDMTTDKVNAFVGAFRKLKQRVIWKRDTNVTNLPPNIRMYSWLPQQDLLGHPKIKAFITQGGQLSYQEAVYHGVPVIGMPIIGDQFVNVRNMHEKGIGVEMDYTSFDERTLYDTLMKLVRNSSYKKNCGRYSALMRDRSLSAIDTIIYWVEYVARHKGAPHLRDNYYQQPQFVIQYFIQYYILDVIGTAIVFVVITFIAVTFVLRKTLKAIRAVSVTLCRAMTLHSS